MLFLLFKNAKDSSYSWINLFYTGTGNTYEEKSFDGKIWESHEMVITDVCHTYQFKR